MLCITAKIGRPCLEWGHFRPIHPGLPAGPCLLRSEGDRIAALPQSDALGLHKSGSGSEARVQASAGLRPLRLVTFDGVTGAA